MSVPFKEELKANELNADVEEILDKMDYCRQVRGEIAERYLRTDLNDDEENNFE